MCSAKLDWASPALAGWLRGCIPVTGLHLSPGYITSKRWDDDSRIEPFLACANPLERNILSRDKPCTEHTVLIKMHKLSLLTTSVGNVTSGMNKREIHVSMRSSRLPVNRLHKSTSWTEAALSCYWMILHWRVYLKSLCTESWMRQHSGWMGRWGRTVGGIVCDREGKGVGHTGRQREREGGGGHCVNKGKTGNLPNNKENTRVCDGSTLPGINVKRTGHC